MSADATGGSIAAACSVALFYPLELARVYLQTGNIENSDGANNTNIPRSRLWTRNVSNILTAIGKGLLNSMDKAIALRLLHTLITSFLYYRIYGVVNKAITSTERKRSVWSNIFSSNTAAMLTVILAMPLESLILKAQVAPQRSSNSNNTNEQETQEENTESFWDTLMKNYRGLTPALLLCLNPMIHYSIYDWLKLETLNQKIDSRLNANLGASGTSRFGGIYVNNVNPIINRNKLTYDDLDDHQLEFREAFIIGIIAKFVATIITFPLLKAKVLMMTSSNTSDLMKTLSACGGLAQSSGDEYGDNSNSESPGRESDGHTSSSQGTTLSNVFLPTNDNGISNGISNNGSSGRGANPGKEGPNVGKKKAKMGFLARYTTFSNLLRTSSNLATVDGETEGDDSEDSGVLDLAAVYLFRTDLGKLLNTLVLVLRMQGLGGLYTGVVVHLFHTTLRGAVSMSLKERFVMMLRQYMDKR